MTALTYIPITPQQAQAWLTDGTAMLIDVREPDEYKAEHIVYAASLPLALVNTLPAHINLPQDKKIIFQCLKGKRGEQACAILPAKREGQIYYNLEGGIDAWKAAGLPVLTARSAIGISLFRQVQIIMGSLIALCVILGFSGLPAAFALGGLFATALAISGVTGWCGLALLLQRAPWNR